MGTLTTCRLCGRTLVSRFHKVLDPQTREIFQILACPSCRHAQTWPVPAVMESYYGKQYYGGRHGRTADYCACRRLRLVTKISGQGNGRRLLDVGCGNGTFLLKAKDHGWQVQGTEMNPDLARRVGLDVYGSLDEAAAIGPFDCITAWHVLEHFPDPLAELQTIGKLLAPGGSLILAVPDAEGTQARLWGRKWFHLDVPRHLHHFSKRSLDLHLAKTGFAIERVWHGELEYDLLGWSQSALNWLLPHPNMFFEVLTGRTAASGRVKRTAHFFLGVLFCGLALLPTWWGMLVGRAGTLIVAARPCGHTSADSANIQGTVER
jgi:SAM-dependent methyltransferase